MRSKRIAYPPANGIWFAWRPVKIFIGGSYYDPDVKWVWVWWENVYWKFEPGADGGYYEYSLLNHLKATICGQKD